MIKVVFLIRSLGQGGTERQLATLAPRLNKDRFEVTVITFYPDGKFGAELAANNVKVVTLNKRGRWDIFGFLWRLVSELKRIRPDILHSYLVEPNLVAAFLKLLFPSTRIVWGIRASKRDLAGYELFVRMNFTLQAAASQFANLIIFNSKRGRDNYLRLGFPPQRSLVIHPGINTDEFRADRQLGIAVRKTWDVAEGTILIGMVGRFDPVKDHRTFVKAAALLSAEVIDCSFVFVGNGSADYVTRLHRIVADYNLSNRVIWAGARTDMPAVYNALNIACLSSTSEGVPNAVAEAMSCGIPCVVTDVGDSALLVGETGFVVPPRNPEALAGALKKCIENLRAGVRVDPRQRILTEFNVQRLVERTEEALGSLTEN